MKKKLAIGAFLAMSAATALFAAKVPPAGSLTATCTNGCSAAAGFVLTFQGTGFSGSQVLLVVTQGQATAGTQQITAQVNNGTIGTGPEQGYFTIPNTYEVTPYGKSGKTYVPVGPGVPFTVGP
mgnify:CR=1 FL=1